MHDTGCHMDSRRETFASFPVIFFITSLLSTSIEIGNKNLFVPIQYTASSLRDI